MYAAAGGASLAGRKARQHGRQGAPASPSVHSPHAAHPGHAPPAPKGVRAYSCQHWESRLSAPLPKPPLRPASALFEAPPDLLECAAGRAAWQEAALHSVGEGGAAGGAARRCSVLGDHPGARRDLRKWHRNNRVRDASYASSDSDGDDGLPGEPYGVARLLYAGLGILALGLVVYFVGTGDKGFKTPELRLVGPCLIITGLLLCVIRISFCVFSKNCCPRRTKYDENRRLDGCAEGEEMPLARGPRAGPPQCSPARRLDTSSCDVSSLSSGEEDERLRRYRITPSHSHSHHSNPQTSSPRSTTPHLHQGTIQIAVQQKQEAPRQTTVGGSGVLASSVRQGTVEGGTNGAPKRPPPRNVSFATTAGGAEEELVLSPAQLRS